MKSPALNTFIRREAQKERWCLYESNAQLLAKKKKKGQKLGPSLKTLSGSSGKNSYSQGLLKLGTREDWPQGHIEMLLSLQDLKASWIWFQHIDSEGGKPSFFLGPFFFLASENFCLRVYYFMHFRRQSKQPQETKLQKISRLSFWNVKINFKQGYSIGSMFPEGNGLKY